MEQCEEAGGLGGGATNLDNLQAFPKQNRFIEFQQKVFKNSEQFVLREQMHAHNIGGCNVGVRFKTQVIVRLCPKITRLYPALGSLLVLSFS